MSAAYTDEAPIINDDQGFQRKLGCLPNVPGFTSTFKTYESSGPMFSMNDLVKLAQYNDTKGRSKFDPSWIMDQKSHGSCNGFAAAGALSRSRVRRGLEKVLLSGAYAYSLMNGGRDQGSTLEDGMRVVQERGIATLQTVPWDAIYPSRYNRAIADAEAARFKAFECYQVNTELELFSAVAAGFDVVVAVHVGGSFQRLNSDGIAGVDRGAGNHSVGGDGYAEIKGRLVLDMFNSWNTSFGDQGRCYLTWDGHLAQTVQYHRFYAYRSTTDDPQGNNPPVLK